MFQRKNSALSIMLLVALLLCAGCIGQREQQVRGEFQFSDTDLVVELPENWQAVSIPGSNWPLLATGIDYGIRPNIRLVHYSTTPLLQEDVGAYLRQEQENTAGYRIVSESELVVDGFSSVNKIRATRMNADNIPLVHLSYVLTGERSGYILAATCAEPSLARMEPLFDDIVGSAKIRR